MPVFEKLSSGEFKPGIMLLELIVIIFGISASFWVDEWREKKQDTEVFDRILGEVYYSLALDDSSVSIDAFWNNDALILASNLAVKNKNLPEAAKLFEQINLIFKLTPFNVTTGPYDRLVNTSLAITKSNQTQTVLDRAYGDLRRLEEENHQLFFRLQNLAEEHWLSQGVVECRLLDPFSDWFPALDLKRMLAPAMFSVRSEEGECLTDAANHEIALRLVESDSFKVALLRVINIRQLLAWNHRVIRMGIEMARRDLLVDQPQLTMPIQSIQLVGKAVGGDEPKDGIQLQQVGPVEWQATITLKEGWVRFAANNSNNMSWSRQGPWLGGRGEEYFDAGEDESWFPANTAVFGWHLIESEPGTYEVHFNSQTYEYRFDKIE